jgi:hypothetical protein
MGLLEEVAEQRQWEVDPADLFAKSLVSLLCTFRELGHERLLAGFARYAELADEVAEVDLASIGDLSTPEMIVESAVVGTVLGDAVFIALRRLAQQNASRKMFGDAGAPSASA